MKIGELARSGSVGVETIRYYQRRGLLEEPSRADGVRRYDSSDARRLRFIRSAQGAGFTLEEIGELLALDASEDRDRARILASNRIAKLDTEIARLRAARKALARLAGDCRISGAGPCPIISAFEPPAQEMRDKRSRCV